MHPPARGWPTAARDVGSRPGRRSERRPHRRWTCCPRYSSRRTHGVARTLAREPAPHATDPRGRTIVIVAARLLTDARALVRALVDDLRTNGDQGVIDAEYEA